MDMSLEKENPSPVGDGPHDDDVWLSGDNLSTVSVPNIVYGGQPTTQSWGFSMPEGQNPSKQPAFVQDTGYGTLTSCTTQQDPDLSTVNYGNQFTGAFTPLHGHIPGMLYPPANSSNMQWTPQEFFDSSAFNNSSSLPQDYRVRQAPAHNPSLIGTKRRHTGEEPLEIPGKQLKTEAPNYPSGTNVSQGTPELIRTWVESCCRGPRQAVLTEEILASLSVLTKDSRDAIRDFILSDPQLSTAIDFQASSYQPSPYQTSEPPQIPPQAPEENADQNLGWIRKFIQNARKKCGAKAKTDGRRGPAPNAGQYFCTSRCGYRTHLQHDWRRHEENRQPQVLWLCQHCKTRTRSGPFIAYRKDKMKEHVKKVHASLDPEEVLKKSKVPYRAGFKRRCGFCSHRFDSWKSRCDHILHHFQNEKRTMDEWKDDLMDDEEEEDDVVEVDISEHEDDDNDDRSPDPDPDSSGGAAPGGTSGGWNNPYGGSDQGPTQGDGSGGGSTFMYPGNVDSGGYGGQSYQPYHYKIHGLSVARGGFGSAPESSPSLLSSLGKDKPLKSYSWPPLPNVLCRDQKEAAESDTIKLVPVQLQSQQGVLKRVEQLGHGAYAVVDRVVHAITGEEFARKTLLSSKHGNHLQERVWKEVEIMKKLSHPHIVKFVDVFTEGSALSVLLKPVADSTLKDYIERPERWPHNKDRITTWLGSLASGLSYIHSKRIRHADIKPQNILLRDSDVLFSDFGISRCLSETQSTSSSNTPMTPMYAAPEIVNRQRHGRKADVFSLGCVYSELATVLSGKSLAGLMAYLRRQSGQSERSLTYYNALSWVHKWMVSLEGSSTYAEVITTLCRSMMESDAQSRPSASELARHIALKTQFSLPQKAIVTDQKLEQKSTNEVIGDHMAHLLTDLRPWKSWPGSLKDISCRISHLGRITGLSNSEKLSAQYRIGVVKYSDSIPHSSSTISTSIFSAIPSERLSSQKHRRSWVSYDLGARKISTVLAGMLLDRGGLEINEQWSQHESCNRNAISDHAFGCRKRPRTASLPPENSARKGHSLKSERSRSSASYRFPRTKMELVTANPSGETMETTPAVNSNVAGMTGHGGSEVLLRTGLKPPDEWLDVASTIEKQGKKGTDLFWAEPESSMRKEAQDGSEESDTKAGRISIGRDIGLDADILGAGSHLSGLVAPPACADGEWTGLILPGLSVAQDDEELDAVIMELVIRQNASGEQQHPGERFLQESSCSTTYDRIQRSFGGA